MTDTDLLEKANSIYPGVVEKIINLKEGCECDRPDERDNPHRHEPSVACAYWLTLKAVIDA